MVLFQTNDTMLTHHKRTLTVVDFSDNFRPRKRMRVRYENCEDEPFVDPENDLKQFHYFEKLPKDVKNEILSYFSEVELIRLARTSNEFFELQKSLIPATLASVRLNRLKATRADPANLSPQQLQERAAFITAQLIAQEEETEAMKLELQRVIKLNLERSDLTPMQRFDLWRHSDVPKKIHKYVQNIQPEGVSELGMFLQEKLQYGFADRGEFLTLDKMLDSLEYALGLKFDEETREWTGDAASLELFTKYTLKMMELDFGGCFWDW